MTSLSRRSRAYNRVRRLLRVLAQTRRGTHRTEDGRGQAISGLDFARLNHASLYADPVAMAASLEEICAALPSGADLPVDALGGPAPARPRLLLMGPNLAAGDYDLFTMVSDAGADIVVEDIFEGIRDYWQTVDLSGHQDRIEALARAYLIDKRPAAFMRGSLLPRLDFVLRPDPGLRGLRGALVPTPLLRVLRRRGVLVRDGAARAAASPCSS